MLFYRIEALVYKKEELYTELILLKLLASLLFQSFFLYYICLPSLILSFR